MPHIPLPEGAPGPRGPDALSSQSYTSHERTRRGSHARPQYTKPRRAGTDWDLRFRGSGKEVTAEDIAQARRGGATDLEIHDTVLIAANFCMMNRYVDGLDAWTPDDPDFYRERAAGIAVRGYAGSESRG
jgi:hypothetical protein